jgi:hypothetical protein
MLKSWESSCCGLERQLELTTAPLGVRDLRLNSPLESGLCWRRLTRQFSWLECLSETGIIRTELVQDLLKEANELVAIFAASYRTARR